MRTPFCTRLLKLTCAPTCSLCLFRTPHSPDTGYTAPMRYILLLFLLAVAIWYATIGVRIGYLPDLPLSFWNAEGTNEYPINVRVTNAIITVGLDASVTVGRVDVDLIAPNGRVAWQGRIEAGRKPVFLTQQVSAFQPGFYLMTVHFRRATGRLNLTWSLQGNY